MENLKKELGIIGLSKQQIDLALKAIEGIRQAPEIYFQVNELVAQAVELKQLKGGLAELAAGSLRQPLKPGPKKEKNPGGITRTPNSPVAESKVVKLKQDNDLGNAGTIVKTEGEAYKVPKRKPGRDKKEADQEEEEFHAVGLGGDGPADNDTIEM